jgi:hypothetical protein
MAAKGLGTDNSSIPGGLEAFGRPPSGFNLGHDNTLLEYLVLSI